MHPGLGVPGEIIDPNGLSTVLRYDRFRAAAVGSAGRR